MSSKRLIRFHSTNSISEFYQLKLQTPEHINSANHPPKPYTILPHLSKYETIFNEPTTLPPPQTLNYSIYLEPDTSTVNLKEFFVIEVEGMILFMLYSTY